MNFNSIVDICSLLLKNSVQAESCRNYLDQRISKETQKIFGFGYFPNQNDSSLLTSQIAQCDLEELNLMYFSKIADSQSIKNIDIYFFENHPLIMPYRDVYGEIIGLVGRSLLDDEQRDSISKYKNTDFKKSNHVFGLFEAKQDILKNNFAYIVEGQFDMIKAFESGIKNVVAIGSANLSAIQLSLICRYTDNVVLLLDNDKAGQIGRERAAKLYSKYANINYKVCLPQGYKDLDEYLTNSGNNLELINSSLYF